VIPEARSLLYPFVVASFFAENRFPLSRAIL